MKTLEHRFIGMEEMSVDEKGRVGIPAKFMNVLRAVAPGQDGQVGLMLTPDRSIKIMPLPYFNELLERWDGYDDVFEEDRLLLNMGPATADLVTLDKQNRIKLSPRMMKMCAIERNAVITGHMKYMQLFSDTVFEEMVHRGMSNWGAAASRVAERGKSQPVQQFVINAVPEPPRE